ncbi:MAG: GNAT family N-acetyltransferase [Desulfobacula sp.]|nr:GNAT family N-acetyltransferase [Desulfobacula sp.]MCD4723143.1 GNAT family N-acetyltransferase [Desulfobacula sp.]
MQLKKEELRIMLNRRGFVPELSFGAFENDKITAFTLNGIGLFNGVKTAYDTGTGTLKEFRGQGMATKIFTHSIPFLKKAGISQYLLEVLQHNTKAVTVYKKLGFIVNREFNYFVQKNENICLNSKKIHPEYNLQQTDLYRSELMIEFWDFIPSWQNSFEAISRKPDDFRIIGAYKGSELVGYCIIETNSGDITQIAVDKEYRRRGIASVLLKESLKFNQYNSIKVVNTELDCGSITGFLQSNAIPLKGKQFEMIKQL